MMGTAEADNTYQRIALITPPSGPTYRKAESLGLRYIAASLNSHGFEYELFDADAWGWTKRKLFESISTSKSNIFGIQITFAGQIEILLEIIFHIKKKTIPTTIVIGGHLPTITPNFFLNYKDIKAVFIGEAEKSIIEFLTNLDKGISTAINETKGIAYRTENGIQHNAQTTEIASLDSLSAPLRDSRDFERYNVASMLGSRGCLYKCSFCSVGNFSKLASGKYYRQRTVENIITEIEQLNSDYGITNISFLDDLFLTRSKKSKHRCLKFANILREKNIKIKFSIECRSDSIDGVILQELRLSGLRRVFLGIESATPATLEYYHKKLSALDHISAFSSLDDACIPVSIGFMLFNPQSDLFDIKDNLLFLKKYGRLRARHIASKMQIYPGTYLWKASTKTCKNIEPYPIGYKFKSNDVTTVFSILKDIETILTPIDNALNFAEFSYAQANDNHQHDKFKQYRNLEKKGSELIADAIQLTTENDSWISSLEKRRKDVNAIIQKVDSFQKECKKYD